MTVRIRAPGDDGILGLVYSEDEVTEKDLTRQRRMLAEAMVREDCNRVLVDITRLKYLPSMAAMMDHNSAITLNSYLLNARFAVLCKSIDAEHQFLEDTGVNRGVQMKCFTERAEAVAWLKK